MVVPFLVKKNTKAAGKPAAQPAAQQTLRTDGFKLKAKMTGKPEEIGDALRMLSFLAVAVEKEAVSAAYVESRDINNQPYIFSILKLNKDEMELIFSIPPEVAPKRRKLNMIRYFLNVLSLIQPYYDIDNKAVYQLIENALKELEEFVTLDYNKLYTAYDTLKKDVEDMRKKIKRLSEENDALSRQNYELKNKNDELTLRVNALEALSDETLKTKIQEWLIEHNSEINISEFAKIYKVSETRVEEILNTLVTEGFIVATQ